MTQNFAARAFAFVTVTALACVSQADQPTTVPLYQQVIAQLQSQNSAVSRVMPEHHPVVPVFNEEAPIPPQCYTKTDGQFNPCYVCHQNERPGRENSMNDGHLQLAYSFSDVGMTNHWENLFENRSERAAKISDEEIRAWIAQDNYSELAGRLREEGFNGWIPDLKNLHLGADAFDEHGFALDGSHWVAFNYKPVPSTFWPTNGATDDVMIRLAKEFRTDDAGNYSLDVYRANLAIVEARVKDLPVISSLPVDERKVGVDLNGDGELSVVQRISQTEEYVGQAKAFYNSRSLFPRGTEFLHTVRYVGVTDDNEITISTRMREVRYMRKWKDYMKVAYRRTYQVEDFAKEAGSLPQYALVGDMGLDNGFGWALQGFIEGRDGRLRTLTYEENLFCMGCHTSIGSTIDKTFSFPRKVDGAGGWGYINLRGMPDAPNRGETLGEIATYLSRVGGGGEFRSNDEMAERWFNDEGEVDLAKIAAAEDVYELIAPSPERALKLNKAYRVIVEDQDYIFGREARLTPPENVYRFIDNDTAPTLPAEVFYSWDIRLAWPEQAVTGM